MAIILKKALSATNFENGETLFPNRKNIIAKSSLTQ